MSISRRSFLRTAGLGAGAMAFLGGLRRLGVNAADASACLPPSDYKALVCVFLYGGNDGNNMIVPNNPTGKYAFSKYSAVRNATSCDFYLEAPGGADPARVGLPINPLNTPSRSFLLHPRMTSLQQQFTDRNLAILFNAGTLVEPTRKVSGALVNPAGGAATLPSSLMAHDQQQREWQLGKANPDFSASVGWGGAISDQLPFEDFPMVLSDAGTSTFARGAKVERGPMIIPAAGTLGFTDSSGLTGAQSYLAELANQASSIPLVAANQSIMRNAIDYTASLGNALGGCTPTWGSTWDNPQGRGNGRLWPQLKKIAEVIAAAGSASLSLKRQVFFCSLGGFDTHADQWETQSELLDELDFSLGAFFKAMQLLGRANNVTSFTMSDFGRTFLPGSFSGTDHAWGSHHLILGGAVKGGKTFGTYPDLTLGGDDDKDGAAAGDGEGRWIPTTSVEQYAATLAEWFEPSLTLSGSTGVFPNLTAFAPNNLGFLV